MRISYNSPQIFLSKYTLISLSTLNFSTIMYLNRITVRESIFGKLVCSGYSNNVSSPKITPFVHRINDLLLFTLRCTDCLVDQYFPHKDPAIFYKL